MTNFSDSSVIILGVGALGSYLSYDININKKNLSFYLFSNSKIPNKLRIKPLDKKFITFKLNFAKKATIKSYRFNDKFLSNIYIFICTPPQNSINDIEFIEKLIKSFAEIKTINIVFLSNGIVNYELLTKLCKYKEHRISFFRGIVLSGFIRKSKLSYKNLIFHTSGNTIYYNNILNNNSSLNEIQFKSFSLNWVINPNILKIEKAKFFTNFLLGLVIGPHLIENIKIFSLLEDFELSILADCFCDFFPNDSLETEFILKYLYEVVEKTHKNVNSLSLSWSLAKLDSIRYFVFKFESLLRESNLTKDKENYLIEFLSFFKTKHALKIESYI